jgi:hypothetical protein
MIETVIEHYERWLPVVGYEGLYEVSNLGRVRRVASAFFWRPTGKILRPQVDHCGYAKVFLSTLQKKRRWFFVHGLVAAAFIGLRPKGHQVDHKDRVKTNNATWNLRYLTGKDNTPRGERRASKLTKKDVLEIRQMRAEGFQLLDIAERFGISASYVANLANHRKWNQQSMQED